MKTCFKCKKTKEASDFHKNRTTKLGISSSCKECACKTSLDWYRGNPARVLGQRLKKYKLSVQDYNTIFMNQNGSCAICKNHQSILNRRLVVDHCHRTGKVRGLLCNACNSGIGHLKDNLVTLLSAASYLKNSEVA